MKLVEYDRKKLENAHAYRRTKILVLLEEFVNSDMGCVKIEGWEHKTPSSFQGVLNRAIKRYKMYGVEVVVLNREVFLVKKEFKD